MSYELYIVDKNGKAMTAPFPHAITGANYCVGGSPELYLSITYNYSKIFKKAFQHDDGIYAINGMSCLQSIPIINAAMNRLGDETTSNYWDATEGNAKCSLMGLLQLAALGCDGFWEVN